MVKVIKRSGKEEEFLEEVEKQIVKRIKRLDKNRRI